MINIDTFISSKFDMYCGGCYNTPFWRWLKRNQQFSLSVTCNDYDGVYLYNIQPNNDTDCFSEYLCTLYFERVINCIANTLKISTCFSMKMMYPHSWNNVHAHWYATFSYVYYHIYIDKYIVRCPRVSIPR